MTLAILVAVLSVAVGALLAARAGSGAWYFVPVRSFALSAVTVVVLLDLLPESLASVGPLAALAFLIGMAAPSVAGSLASRLVRSEARRELVCMEVTYAGLLVHKLGDGLALGAVSSDVLLGHAHEDLVIAIAAHTIPVTALVVVAFQRHLGAARALLRAAGLAVAGVAGVGLAAVAEVTWLAAAEPWGAAVVAGLLLHVLTHDAGAEVPRDGRTRTAELIAIALGVALPFAGGHGHPHADAGARAVVMEALGHLILDTSPMLLLGFTVSAALQASGRGIPQRWLDSGSNLRQALRGAGIGAPIPVCSCGVLPLATALRSRKAGAAFVIAFLIATPELGLETVALTVKFLGWQFAVLRVIAALGVAVLAALVVAMFAPGPKAQSTSGGGHAHPHAHQHAHEHAHEHDQGRDDEVPVAAALPTFRGRFVAALDELVRHVGPWTLLGLVAAAYVEAMVTPDSFASLGASGLDILVVTLVSVPSYVCAGSATPLAATLLAKGLSPGAVLAGLLLGPATNLATLGFLRSAYGAKATAAGLAAAVAGVWVTAALLNLSDLGANVQAVVVQAHPAGLFELGGTVLMSLLVLWSLWRGGVRTWLAELGFGHVHAH